MQDKPTAEELLESIQDFLMKEVLPEFKTNELLSYKTLVSWNMLGVVIRELKETNISTLRDNFESSNRRLAEIIRKDKISVQNREIWDEVKVLVKDKCRIANPKIL